MNKGVYYNPKTDEVMVFTNVKKYEDIFSPPFYILTWEYRGKSYPKTMITQKQTKLFKRIGSL